MSSFESMRVDFAPLSSSREWIRSPVFTKALMTTTNTQQLEIWQREPASGELVWRQLPSANQLQLVKQLAALLMLAARKTCPRQDEVPSSKR